MQHNTTRGQVPRFPIPLPTDWTQAVRPEGLTGQVPRSRCADSRRLIAPHEALLSIFVTQPNPDVAKAAPYHRPGLGPALQSPPRRVPLGHEPDAFHHRPSGMDALSNDPRQPRFALPPGCCHPTKQRRLCYPRAPPTFDGCDDSRWLDRPLGTREPSLPPGADRSASLASATVETRVLKIGRAHV